MTTPMTLSSAINVDVLGTCPLPVSRYDQILLGHGSGGSLTAELIQRIFVPGFGGDTLAALEDQATVRVSPDHSHNVLSLERRRGEASHVHVSHATPASTRRRPAQPQPSFANL